jgi:hypothetical protein
MQQITDWLKKLGMPEYGGRFAENGIDFSVLPHLTDQDLKDMGVLLGHRRKMLGAIGELSSQSAAACASDGRTYRAGSDPDRPRKQSANAATSPLKPSMPSIAGGATRPAPRLARVPAAAEYRRAAPAKRNSRP